MKILGISLGTKNGNNDTMCRVALEAAKEKGAEIEFIHLMDWDIDYCSGCVACSRGLVMGKGMICTRKDDFDALYTDSGCQPYNMKALWTKRVAGIVSFNPHDYPRRWGLSLY